MATQRYSVTPPASEPLLARVEANEMAIPKIQRPSVLEPAKVRIVPDSL